MRFQVRHREARRVSLSLGPKARYDPGRSVQLNALTNGHRNYMLDMLVLQAALR